MEEKLNVFQRCEAKLAAQKCYCQENGKPFFATSIYCPFCHGLVYNQITREQAASQLITGCPECHKSFTD